MAERSKVLSNAKGWEFKSLSPQWKLSYKITALVQKNGWAQKISKKARRTKKVLIFFLFKMEMRERKIKMVIETSDISNLSPSAASYFKLHKCENSDVEWKMILDNKMSTLIQVCLS